MRSLTDGSFCFAGRCGYEPFVVRTDANGNVLWAYNYDTGASSPLYISKKNYGGYQMSGFFGFGYQALGEPFTMSLQSDGTLDWGRRYDNTHRRVIRVRARERGLIWPPPRRTELVGGGQDTTVEMDEHRAGDRSERGGDQERHAADRAHRRDPISMQPKLVMRPGTFRSDCQYSSSTTTTYASSPKPLTIPSPW
ncbi:MAG: hypothetical protein IPO12_09225 [Flavobacteriales bacterium]|nr:hypothetical protein [Flavobacteriales bacterium]